VSKFNTASKSLRTEFDEHFGGQALRQYYLGKTKQAIYGPNDEPLLETDGSQKTKTKNFGVHFNHENLADELGIKFGLLHGILQNYFMATSLYLKTKDLTYQGIADDAFEDFKEGVKSNMMDNHDYPSEDDFSKIYKSVNFVADIMIQHTLSTNNRLAFGHITADPK